MAFPNNSELLLKRCIDKLDNMNHIPQDNRPKTFEKLKNTLQKESQVIYANQINIVLLTVDNDVHLTKNQNICRNYTELDAEIVERTLNYTAENGRQLFVLPCDSDLHGVAREQIKAWYQNRPQVIDPADPVREIACACKVDTRLDIASVIHGLEKLGVVHFWLDQVRLSLPDSESILALQEAWDAWLGRIRTNLSEVSVFTYQEFARLVKQANEKIQTAKVEELGACCEDLYISRYYTYKRAKSDDTVFMDDGEVTLQDAGPETAARKWDLVNTPVHLWSIRMEPSLVYVILKLYTLNKMPEKKQDLIYFIESIADVTFVVSPKQMLLELTAQETSGAEDHVTSNICLGSTVSTDSFSLRDTQKLASVLSFPGKQNLFQRHSFRRLPQDETKETLRAFQSYVLKQVKQLGQRTGSAILFGEESAYNRCRASVQEYLTSLSETNSVTEEDFTREIIRRSYEHANVPIEGLVKLLQDAGYLKVEESGVVIYSQGYIRTRLLDSDKAESGYLTEWEQCYRSHGDQIPHSLLDRKRKMELTRAFHFKRHRLVDH